MTGAGDSAAVTELLAAAISYCEREIATMNASVRLLASKYRSTLGGLRAA